MDKSAKIEYNGKSYDFPIITGSEISGVGLVQENKAIITIKSVCIFFINFILI